MECLCPQGIRGCRDCAALTKPSGVYILNPEKHHDPPVISCKHCSIGANFKKRTATKKEIPKINKPPPLQCLCRIRIKCKHDALPHFISSFLKARGRTRTTRTRTGTRTRARTLGPGVLCPVVLVVVLVVLVVMIRLLISPRIRTKQKKMLVSPASVINAVDGPLASAGRFLIWK